MTTMILLGLRHFLFLSVLLFLSVAQAQTDTPVTTEALFKAGKYKEALQTFEQIGMKSPDDFFNAGLCHFKMNQLGQALAYFEKAHSLDEANEDISFNLNLTRNTLKRVGSLPKDQSFWFGTFVPLARRVPIWILWLLFATSAVILAQIIQAKAMLTYRSPSALGCATTSLCLLVLAIAAEAAVREERAVVVAEHAVAHSGPGPQFTELFQLQAGTIVETEENREGWLKVRFSLGNVGWVVEKELLTL